MSVRPRTNIESDKEAIFVINYKVFLYWLDLELA